MIHLVLINGEKQVGKSTYANALADLLFENHISSRQYSLVAPLEAMTRAFMYPDSEGIPGYEQMKNDIAIPNTIITGRDIMILLGNGFRSLHPYTLSQMLMNEMIDDREPAVWIVENWGFPDESFFWHEQHVQSMLPDVLMIHTIHLDARASRAYAAGEIFTGDNRWCLRHLASHLNPPVNGIAQIIDPDHTYPVDPIAVRFGGETAPILTMAEALERLDSSDDSMWDRDGLPSTTYLRKVTYNPNLTEAEVKGLAAHYGIPNRSVFQFIGDLEVVNEGGSEGDELFESEDDIMDEAMSTLHMEPAVGTRAEVDGIFSEWDGQDWKPIPEPTFDDSDPEANKISQD